MKGKKLLAVFMVVLSMFVMLSSSVRAALPEENTDGEVYYLPFDIPCPYNKSHATTADFVVPKITFYADYGKEVLINGYWFPEGVTICYTITYGKSIGEPNIVHTGKITNGETDKFPVEQSGTYTLEIIEVYPLYKSLDKVRITGELKIFVPEFYSWYDPIQQRFGNFTVKATNQRDIILRGAVQTAPFYIKINTQLIILQAPTYVLA